MLIKKYIHKWLKKWKIKSIPITPEWNSWKDWWWMFPTGVYCYVLFHLITSKLGEQKDSIMHTYKHLNIWHKSGSDESVRCQRTGNNSRMPTPNYSISFPAYKALKTFSQQSFFLPLEGVTDTWCFYFVIIDNKEGSVSFSWKTMRVKVSSCTCWLNGQKIFSTWNETFSLFLSFPVKTRLASV